MASDSSQSRWLRSNFMPVQTAFLFLDVFPPPAAGARVLAGDHGPRAGRAADGAVTLVVERVVRHVEEADVAPDVLFAPLGQRIEFRHAVAKVEFPDPDFRPARGLRAAQ